MQRLPLILGAAALGALTLAGPAWAACKPGGSDAPFGPAVIYDGRIGSEPARLALIFGKDGLVQGRYALATSTSEILISGKIEPGGERMTLTEFDGRGGTSAVFAAVFPDKSGLSVAIVGTGKEGGFSYRPQNAGPPPPNTAYVPLSPGCGTFGGSRQETGGAEQNLDLSSTSHLEHPQFGHLYAIAGVNDDETVNRHAQAFRQAIADGRPEEAAKHMRLPMTFTIRGKLVVVTDAKDLKARFDDIFPQSVRDGIAKLVPRMMQATEFGVRLQNMWFDSEGYLIAY